jgi:hypothetical protein
MRILSTDLKCLWTYLLCGLSEMRSVRTLVRKRTWTLNLQQLGTVARDLSELKKSLEKHDM